MSLLRQSLTLAALATPLCAQDGPGYQLPPPEIVEMVDAAPAPSMSLSPDGRHVVLTQGDALPSIADLARPMLRLGGMRLDPRTNGPYLTSTAHSVFVGPLAQIVGIDSVPRSPVREGWRVAGTSWSHDSRHLAIVTVPDPAAEAGSGTSLTVVAPDGEVRRLATTRLNAMLSSGYAWAPGGEALWIVEVPEDRGAAPEAPRVPSGPVVRSADGAATPLPTFQDLLASPHDEDLFEHYATGQLVRVDLTTGERREVGEPGMFASIDPAPDGLHLLVTRVQRPFSHIAPWRKFHRSIEVWDSSGSALFAIDVPLEENVPLHGVRTGPRSVQWIPGRPATLAWVEALDGGDPEAEVEQRDRWVSLGAPFVGDPGVLFATEDRSRGVTWAPDGRRALFGEYDREERWVRSWLVDLARGGAPPVLVEDRNSRDRYVDPGQPLTVRDARGQRVLLVDDGWIYRTGSGASPEGDRPFLDRQNLASAETERLWRCAPGEYESVSRVLPREGDVPPAVLTRHESLTEPPNYRVRELAAADAAPRWLTRFPDPTPAIRGVSMELVQYERSDGVPLSARLYLPADHEPGTRLPLLVWAYPREYNDARTAAQISGSPHRFTRLRGASHLYLLTQGFAILDGATMPVIGDAETMNDTFIEQIRDAAAAAIDFAVERGVADRDRVVVGGHSYGAFMTANLLAHSDLFVAGIARSGAYNRTLTPFGFQAEQRTLWEAPETYFSVSPFLHADQIDEPLLMLHGQVDSNSGTYPVQSERMFAAVQGLGGTVRLVLLPHESHGYAARESVLHTIREMVDWSVRYAGASRTVEAAAPAPR